jgi:aminobenzoyl-glutamate utilization protein B
MPFNACKTELLQWVDDKIDDLSDWHQVIFDYGETAWREYKSSTWYVERLRAEGFSVEHGSGGMPTAFCAEWSNGEGPTIAGYAEYDAVPGNCQAADTVQRPRDGLNVHAGGHTDPHSALGIGSLGGVLAAKAMMQRHDIKGRLKFFGEPAEKFAVPNRFMRPGATTMTSTQPSVFIRFTCCRYAIPRAGIHIAGRPTR